MLDEPSLGIMPRLVDQVMDSLRRLHESEGLTMFLVEQNVPAALDLADRGYVLQTGRVVLQGKSAELRGSDLVRKAYWDVRQSFHGLSISLAACPNSPPSNGRHLRRISVLHLRPEACYAVGARSPSRGIRRGERSS